jgi:cytochrome c peroxidase
MKRGNEFAERPHELPRTRKSRLAVAVLACLLHAPVYGQNSDAARMLDSMHELPVGLGALPPLTIPADNPSSFLKIELGRRLFFDARLSGNQSMTCATCHDPAKDFSDNRARPMGSHGSQLPRHTPSLLNAGYNSYQFWDGRVSSLEQQAIEPLTSAKEMSMTDEGVLISRLEKDKYYSPMFREVFRDGPSLSNVAKALAAFERTIVGHGSRFDRYANGDKAALTAAEKNGLVLFIGKAHCARCHDGPNFTDNNFHNIGIDTGDDGRFLVTRLKEDRGAFKTPSLRNIAAHAPYMHDGSIPTLDAVIDYYDRGGNPSKGKSPFIFKTGLSNDEKRDLLEFLQTLNEPAGHPEQP